ncbi:hypothetical protein GCM10027098_07110 [Bowmanella dokdonensis]
MVAFILVAGVGLLDIVTGYELAFSLFYLLPVSLAAWFVGKRFGLATSVVSALAWGMADLLSEQPYSHPAILYWNTTIRFGVFLITALLMSSLRQALEREQELSRVDNLTGAVNRRFFAELLQMELDRSQRSKHPLTLAYIDLDNFKAINDRLGHAAGDQLLATTVRQVKGQLRKTDILARLGGDEFAILLPETHMEAAKLVISDVQAHFLNEMHRNNWPVTLSIGVLTCTKIPATTDELLNQADALMYAAKNQGKNAVCYAVYAGD